MTGLFTSNADGTGVREITERMEARDRRSGDNGPQPAFLPTMREIGAIIALISIAYTVGYNWHEVSQLRSDYDHHVVETTEAYKTFTLREVSNGQYLEIQRQLTEINRLLEQARDRKR